MESLIDQANSLLIIERINCLTPQSKAVWGKMDVAQMLAHAQVALLVASGKVIVKRGLIGILFGKMAKKQLMKPEPFKKNLPTAPEFIIKEKPNFDIEKAKLIDLVKRFSQNGHEGVTKETHPFFGKMTAEEWDLLQWKHLDHHLRQFGV